jgi:SAM-dependent methyltransferase
MAWYQEFFDEDYLRFHLRGGAWLAVRTTSECDFIMQVLELTPGAQVLDLCCGQGRHSVELARRGLVMTGADLSGYLLDKARTTAAEAGISVNFHHTDMRELPWRDKFDAVILMFTAFGYLENDTEDLRVLRAIHDALKPGGQVLLDLPSLWHFARKKETNNREWLEFEDHLILEEHSWDIATNHLKMCRTIIAPDGTRREKSFMLRIYAHTEIKAMLAQAGLEWQHTYGDLNCADFSTDNRWMLVVARKP